MPTLKLTATACAAAIAGFFAAGSSSLAGTPEPCRGPFAKCAQDVGGWCESDGKGGQRMTFWGKSGYSAAYEQCVGKVYEAHGKPNPYKPAPQASAPKR